MLFLALLIAVVSVHPDRVEIDRGQIDGLRTGDVGRVFYTLRLGQQSRRINVSSARIEEAGDFSSSIVVPRRVKLKDGYQVEFDIPPERVQPKALQDIAEERAGRGQFDTALRYYHRIKEIGANDPAVDARISQIEERKARQSEEADEGANIGYYQAAAEQLLKQGDAAGARRYLDRLSSLSPQSAEAMRLFEEIRLLESSAQRTDMLYIVSGDYEIGTNLSQAQYYSESPRFRVRLPGFWLDRNPVKEAEYAAVRSSPPVSPGSDQPMTGLTCEEAAQYCRAVGKRLPSELEWEASFPRLEGPHPPLSAEWTSSWYDRYPGNVFPEPEYGERFRVAKTAADPQLRLFVDPNSRLAGVGFRCASQSE